MKGTMAPKPTTKLTTAVHPMFRFFRSIRDHKPSTVTDLLRPCQSMRMTPRNGAIQYALEEQH